jgi:integrase
LIGVQGSLAELGHNPEKGERMAQQGQLYKRNGAWHVRYRVKQTVDGKLVTKRESHRLASIDDYPQKSEVKDLCRDYMAKINVTSSLPEAGASIGDFVEKTYFPKIERRLAKSSVAGYKKGWRTHLKRHMANKRVRDFRPCDAQAVLDALEAEHGQELSHRTYAWLKVTMSAIFAQAVRDGLRDFNPIRNLLTPKGKKHGRKTHAYSLEEIQKHLKVFAGDGDITIKMEDGTDYVPEISRKMVRGLIGVAAYAGLRQGEIRGLWADDDLGDVLHIKRTVWGTSLNEQTKTGEDDEDPGMVPIIKPLRALLDALKPKHGFIFTGSRGAAIDLENLADRVMRPMLAAHKLQWHGWHGYRRGLATNLKQLGIDDVVIQGILRHSDVSTTRKHYIKTVPQMATDAMQKLASQIQWATDGQQQGLPDKQITQ